MAILAQYDHSQKQVKESTKIVWRAGSRAGTLSFLLALTEQIPTAAARGGITSQEPKKLESKVGNYCLIPASQQKSYRTE